MGQANHCSNFYFQNLANISAKTKNDFAKSGSKNEQKLSEVDGVYEELPKSRKGNNSPEQLHAWSHTRLNLMTL